MDAPRLRVGVLASGAGTNLQAILDKPLASPPGTLKFDRLASRWIRRSMARCRSPRRYRKIVPCRQARS